MTDPWFVRDDRGDRSTTRPMVAILVACLLSGEGAVMARASTDKPSAETELPSSDQLEEETSSAPDTEPNQAESAPGAEQKRRLFKRIGPQGLTPEEEEEAARLRKVAAKYGTDPTAIVGRVQISGQYLDLPQGANATASAIRLDLPFRGNYLLRMDLPFLRTNDLNRNGATSQRGFSDLSVIAAWRAYNTPEYAVLAGLLTTFPTAANAGVGLGKYAVGPIVATARFVPRWESFLIGILQYQTSVGGDPSRKDVSFLSATAQVNSFWAERWWTVIQAVWQVDFERHAKSSMAIEFEFGRNLVKTLGAYVRPGVGIYGQSLPGAYQWNVEVGVRFMFGSF